MQIEKRTAETIRDGSIPVVQDGQAIESRFDCLRNSRLSSAHVAAVVLSNAVEHRRLHAREWAVSISSVPDRALCVVLASAVLIAHVPCWPEFESTVAARRLRFTRLVQFERRQP